MPTTRINITITEETQAQAAALLRDQITPNFSGLVRRLVAEAHAKAFSVKPLRRLVRRSPC